MLNLGILMTKNFIVHIKKNVFDELKEKNIINQEKILIDPEQVITIFVLLLMK